MLKFLPQVLQLQEIDMNMIRLMDLKGRRLEELSKMHTLRQDLQHQLMRKEHEVLELKKEIKLNEVRIREIEEKIVQLEGKQSAVKTVNEFNALSQEITGAGREKLSRERETAEKEELRIAEEEVLLNIKESLESTTEGSRAIEEEIREGIEKINQEGREMKVQRDAMAREVDEDFLRIYERLLQNKKDRVVVPIEERTCSGCHIVVTAQHENLVRKGERMVFCEHCSRIHFWPEFAEAAAGEGGVKRRRRKGAATT
ncbi:MAG: hypothetical protein JSR80_03875 [Verrucomicrobia bacterium]|nr:hypothetical protein [Verrucomicrobiota bacterium]